MKKIKDKKKFFWVLGLVTILALVLVLNFQRISQKPAGSIKGTFQTNKLASLENFSPSPLPQVKANSASSPRVFAEYIILVEPQTGFPLFQKNADVPVPIASLTKIMTALIVLEEMDLEKIAEVSKEPPNVIGSKIGLKSGEKIKVGDLFKGLLIYSGNDAAFTLAENNGSISQFVEKMNKKAKELGLTKTYFVDPAGLDSGNLSTARELASLTRYALSFEEFREIVKTPELKIYSVDGTISHEFKNSNRLVTDELYYPGALGVKTGFTPEAGHLLISAAEHNGMALIGVILKTLEDTKVASAKESQKLLDWGFNSFYFPIE